MERGVWTPEMGEISGFGGSYEEGCREMVRAGLQWFDEHPDANPVFKGSNSVFGLILEDNEDAKTLSQVMVDAANEKFPEGGVTGAMHHATVSHVLVIRKLGWDQYVKEMSEREE